MKGKFYSVLCFSLVVAKVYWTEATKTDSNSAHPLGDGHGKPFGKGRPSKNVLVTPGKIFGREFFTEHVKSHEPMVYKGMYTESPAVSMWSDEYFLNLKTIPDDDEILIERQKKEIRTEPVVESSFIEFLKEYNKTDIVMINVLPEYLEGDVQIPSVLQCPHYQTVANHDTIMWFNSGGAKSVVHTESVENLHCVIAGSEKFVLVHPVYKKLIPLDGPGASCSNIDVDAVDYDKYPGLAGVEFQHAELGAGDCIYVPSMRIHQVESFGRTIALNFLWDPSENKQLEHDTCNTEFDPQLTLLNATSYGLDALQFSPVVLKANILESAEAGQFTFDEFPESISLLFYMGSSFKKSKFFENANEKLHQAFADVDKDSDGYIEESDVLAMNSDDWDKVFQKFEELRAISDKYQEFASINDESGERDEL